MIVAITGANGFIGHHLRERFAASGATVRAIIRRDLDGPSIDEMLTGVDVVVHAAGATRAPTRALLAADPRTIPVAYLHFVIYSLDRFLRSRRSLRVWMSLPATWNDSSPKKRHR